LAELQRTRKALKDRNAENAKWRKKLDAFEADEQQRKQANMTELERIQAQLADLQTQNARLAQERQDTAIRAEIMAEATRQGFTDPQDAYKLVDLATVEVGDDGAIASVAPILKNLGESKPYLLQQQGALSPTNPGRQEPQGETDKERRERLFGGGRTPFGRASGGGVVWDQRT
jgi:hypothetical protein